jgi:hypothetical protein
MQYAGVSIGNTGSDTVKVGSSVLSTTLIPSADTNVCQYSTREVSEALSRDYNTCVAGLTAGAPVTIAVTLDGNSVSVQNGGTGAVNTTITSNAVGAVTATQTVTETVLPNATTVVKTVVLRPVFLPAVTR